MLPPVVEQQAKLGVSAEDSKAQRLKRQQARFRDRGGAFVPSTSNPLVDILLARTVSGESPSKACSKDVPARRLSRSKAHQASPARRASTATAARQGQDVPGTSKSKLPASRKRNTKAVEPEADTGGTKPPPKRRGAAKGKKKAGIDPDQEQPLLATKSKSTSKGKDKQRAAPSTSGGNSKAKPQRKTKAKSNLTKQVIEILASDDETLVEVPHKANPKGNVRRRDDIETDDDAPIARERTMFRADDSKASSTKTVKRVKTGKIANTGNSGKKASKDGAEQSPKATTKKRPVSHAEQGEVAAVPPAKKGRTANSTSAKPKAVIEPEPGPLPRPIRSIKKGENLKATAKGKGKVRAEPPQDAAEPAEGDEERPLELVSKSKKRKKEEDSYNDRPSKVVKFSETSVPHSSSRKLKENQSDKKRTAKSSVREDLDVPCQQLATKPSTRAKTPKGPPREVLERIKASAARHLRCADSEPDELDCLS